MTNSVIPLAVCLLETFPRGSYNITFKGFTLYHKFHETENRASGGVSILVNENIPQCVVTVNSNLQAVAVKVPAHKTISLSSVYLRPHNHYNFNPIWYLEPDNKLLTNMQCGLRSRRRTVDHRVRFKTFCWETFIHNQLQVSGFFILEKAYNNTWKYGIMKDLHSVGLRGRLPIFVNILKYGWDLHFLILTRKIWVYIRVAFCK